MNTRSTSYALAAVLVLATFATVAPTATAEHREDVSLNEAVNNEAVDAETADSGPCWYVIVSPWDVGPAEVTIFQCNFDAEVDENWDPGEDPLVQFLGEEVHLDDVSAVAQSDETPAADASADLTAEHCFWTWDGERYCTLTEYVEGIVHWAVDQAHDDGVEDLASDDVGVAIADDHCWKIGQQYYCSAWDVVEPIVNWVENALPGEEAPATPDAVNDVSTTQEHCWSLGAEVGPVWYDHNPCNDRFGTDGDPDSVVIYFGYSDVEVVDGPK